MDQCFGNYYSKGDRCTALSQKNGEIIENCLVYNFNKGCDICKPGYASDDKYCVKCAESCLTCNEEGSDKCLTCADKDLHTNTASYSGTSGTCGTTVNKNTMAWAKNCDIFWGTEGCYKCSTGYGRYLVSGVMTCVKMQGNRQDNCLESADAKGKYCKYCTYFDGYWMRDQHTCSNKAFLVVSLQIVAVMGLIALSFL